MVTQPAIGGRLGPQDSAGVTFANTEGQKATFTYAATIVPTANGPILQIQGSVAKTIRITKIRFTGVLTTAAPAVVTVQRSTTTITGTLTGVTAGNHSLLNPSATATVSSTPAGTAGTTTGGPLDQREIVLGSATVPAGIYSEDYGFRPSQTLQLRGTTDFITLAISTASYTGASITAVIETTEE